MSKHKKKHYPRKMPKAKLWEWIISIAITSLAGIIIWTNETIDLFNKFGINISPKYNIIVFGLIFIFGLSWIVTIYLRHERLI
jgi:hypothetical protein